MEMAVEKWLVDLTEEHQFTAGTKKNGNPYGRANNNKNVQLSADVTVIFPGKEKLELPRGTELTVYQHYNKCTAGTVATIFLPDRLVTIKAGGALKQRPYPGAVSMA